MTGALDNKHFFVSEAVYAEFVWVRRRVTLQSGPVRPFEPLPAGQGWPKRDDPVLAGEIPADAHIRNPHLPGERR